MHEMLAGQGPSSSSASPSPVISLASTRDQPSVLSGSTTRPEKRVRSAAPKFKLEKFDGTLNVTAWQELFKYQVAEYDARSQILSLATALEGRPKEWFIANLGKKKDWNLDQWLEALVKRYPPNCRQDINAMKARRYRVGVDTPRLFVTQLEEELRHMTCCQDRHPDEICEILRENLSNHPQYRELEKDFPTTASTVVGKLLHLESTTRGRDRPSKVSTSVAVAEVSQPSASHENVERMIAQGLQQMASVLDKVTEVCVAQAYRQKREVRCYGCGQPGHYRRNCPDEASRHDRTGNVEGQQRDKRYEGNQGNFNRSEGK